MATITRTPVPVTRRAFMILAQDQYDYAMNDVRSGYATRFTYTCHGCGVEIQAGQRWTQLRGTSNGDFNVYCRDCGNAWPRS